MPFCEKHVDNLKSIIVTDVFGEIRIKMNLDKVGRLADLVQSTQLGRQDDLGQHVVEEGLDITVHVHGAVHRNNFQNRSLFNRVRIRNRKDKNLSVRAFSYLEKVCIKTCQVECIKNSYLFRVLNYVFVQKFVKLDNLFFAASRQNFVNGGNFRLA